MVLLATGALTRCSKACLISLMVTNSPCSFNFKTLQSRVKEEYTQGDYSQSHTINLRMEKDKTIWISCGKWGKYGGRMLGTLYMTEDDMKKGESQSINMMVVNEGYAYKYSGKKKKKFEEWYVEKN